MFTPLRFLKVFGTLVLLPMDLCTISLFMPPKNVLYRYWSEHATKSASRTSNFLQLIASCLKTNSQVSLNGRWTTLRCGEFFTISTRGCWFLNVICVTFNSSIANGANSPRNLLRTGHFSLLKVTFWNKKEYIFYILSNWKRLKSFYLLIKINQKYIFQKV